MYLHVYMQIHGIGLRIYDCGIEWHVRKELVWRFWTLNFYCLYSLSTGALGRSVDLYLAIIYLIVVLLKVALLEYQYVECVCVCV